MSGTLRITESCVYAESPGERMVLVWHAERTDWDGNARTITLRNHDGTVVVLRDGDGVRGSGGGSSFDEGGGTAEAWLASVAWVSAPRPDCPMDARWFVNDLAPA